MKYCIIVLVLVATIGCGKSSGIKVVPVTGTVKYNGTAIAGAMVTFVTTSTPRPAVGVTDSSGNFKLTTMNTNDGAVAGDHIITIVKVPAASAAPTGSGPGGMSTPEDYMKMMAKSKDAKPPGMVGTEKGSIPAKYASEKAGLKRTVVAGETNNFIFDLTD